MHEWMIAIKIKNSDYPHCKYNIYSTVLYAKELYLAADMPKSLNVFRSLII